jgi:hypothetical protein
MLNLKVPHQKKKKTYNQNRIVNQQQRKTTAKRVNEQSCQGSTN